MYSDFVEDSDEEFQQIETELWNPNEIIDKINQTNDINEKKNLKKQLLQKFLDQKRPIISSKMKDYLLEEDILQLLISFVTRLDEQNVESTSFINNQISLRNFQNQQNGDNVRRSYNVMELFLNPMNDLDILFEEKLSILLNELFKIFQPNSMGNFLHFHKILDQFLIRSPVETTKFLISNNLFSLMFNFLHEPGMIDTCINIFCCGFPKQSDTVNYYKSLSEYKIFEKIGEKIYGKDQKYSSYSADFFNKLMEKLSLHEMSGILFVSLCKNSNFIDHLFETLVNKDKIYSLEQQLSCAQVLRELLIKSGEKSIDQMDFSKPIPNMLSAVHDKLHEYSKAHISDLCNLLCNFNNNEKPIIFPSYTVKKPFGMFRFYLIEILGDIISITPDSLNNVTIKTWKLLIDWFFQYPNNNLYHFQFFKIIKTVIKINHQESLKVILNKYKFLSKLIDEYNKNELSASRGFVIQISNILRLAADTQPYSASAGNLKHYLISHSGWQEFLPILRRDTLQQLKRFSDFSISYNEDGEDEDDSDNIDLGSKFAKELGFEQNSVIIEDSKKKKKKKKKKKGNNSHLLNSFSPIPIKNNKEKQMNGVIKHEKGEKSSSSLDWWNNLKQDFQKEELEHDDYKDTSYSVKEELEKAQIHN